MAVGHGRARRLAWISVLCLLMGPGAEGIDGDEAIRFDNLEPVDGLLRSLPYAPHTIGKAGLFYESRIRPHLIESGND